MYKCSESELREVISLLEKDIKNCIYMYIDIVKYGINNKNLDLWIKRNDSNIRIILMKYYDSMQIYSIDDEVNDDDLIDIIRENSVMMISGKPSIIKSIHSHIKYQYDIDYGIVLKQEIISNNINDVYIQKANEDDLYDIAKLICSSKEIGGHYTISSLTNQFKDRMSSNMGRNYIIKEENEIVAHYGTYAEVDKLAVLGGLIVDNKKRNKGLAKKLHSFVSSDLISEGKEVFLFCHDEEIANMYKRLGAIVCSEYAKLTKI